MTTNPQTDDSADYATIINALSFGMQRCIEDAEHWNPKIRRVPDFGCVDRAIAAAQRLAAERGPDTVLPLTGEYAGVTPRGLLEQLQGVAAQVAPYRPKVRRA